jgi:5-hydroxyisourate hydrolase
VIAPQQRSHVTSHVLDAALGRPASGIPLRLERLVSSAWDLLGEQATDEDGRATQLGPVRVESGIYRLVFDTAEYFAAQGHRGFYPQVVVVFEVVDAEQHYHVPVLLSPFAYSTYRGS